MNKKTITATAVLSILKLEIEACYINISGKALKNRQVIFFSLNKKPNDSLCLITIFFQVSTQDTQKPSPLEKKLCTERQ